MEKEWFGSRMMRAVTEIDSGRARVCVLVGEELKASCLFLIEYERSRFLYCSGEESRDIDGDGDCLVRELALSAIDGDLEPPALCDFRTAKKVGVVPTAGPALCGATGVPVVLDSFSKALILCEIPDPTFTFLMTGDDDGCWLMRLR